MRTPILSIREESDARAHTLRMDTVLMSVRAWPSAKKQALDRLVVRGKPGAADRHRRLANAVMLVDTGRYDNVGACRRSSLPPPAIRRHGRLAQRRLRRESHVLRGSRECASVGPKFLFCREPIVQIEAVLLPTFEIPIVGAHLNVRGGGFIGATSRRREIRPSGLYLCALP